MKEMNKKFMEEFQARPLISQRMRDQNREECNNGSSMLRKKLINY